MPVISMDCGSLTKEQKKDLIVNFTKVASEVTGVPSSFFTVLLRELPDENRGFGGKTVEEIINSR